MAPNEASSAFARYPETTTDAAASHVKGPEKTESRRRVNLEPSERPFQLTSIAAPRLRWCPGMSDIQPLSAVGPTSRRSSSTLATDKVVHGCAASCRASGCPSSSAHRAETVGTLSRVNRKAGSAASRQSQNIWTAGARRARRGFRTPLGGSRSGPTLRTCSPWRSRRMRLVASTVRSGSPSRAREMTSAVADDESIPSTSTIRRRRVGGDGGSGDTAPRESSSWNARASISLGPACRGSLTISVTSRSSDLRRRMASSARPSCRCHSARRG